jgi:hypothetical protein
VAAIFAVPIETLIEILSFFILAKGESCELDPSAFALVGVSWE